AKQFTSQRQRYQNLRDRLRALDPKTVLSRGYSILIKQNGQFVRHANEVTIHEQLRTILARGELEVRVEKIQPPPEGP
ncbi:MAG: exodeoxyribonuclease VII large subunit, partial [Lentisphaerae bacterium]